MADFDIQLGLFGAPSTFVGYHVVAAHTRVLGDGTEVFVGEHLRWNRGRTTVSGGATATEEPAPEQIPLFAPRR